jgi:dihydropteroate synthase
MVLDLATRFPGRATTWKLRTKTLRFGKRPLVMGIVNVTPDSFSDGGRFAEQEKAVVQAIKLLEEGAEILDVGGESTRPYATPVMAAEEMERVLPVIEEVRRHRPDAVLSVDTSKAEVARAAVDLGVEIVNDVTGLAGDGAMVEAVRASGVGVCVMHMKGTPQTMQDDPAYGDVVAEVRDYLRQRRDALVAAGIERERICLDPGIGFGKTHQHSLTLMANCWRLHELGMPILVGHSRKGFLGKLIGDRDADRTAGTIGGALALAQQGVQIVRVHDVRVVREALVLFEACGGIDGKEGRIP